MARHAAVHHVARRDDVRAGVRVARRRLREQLERRVVQDFRGRPRRVSDFSNCRAEAAFHHAAMAVAHVFAQAHVRDDEQRRQFLFQQPHRLLHDAVLRVSAARLRILFVGNAEQQNRRHAERVRRRGLAQNFIRRQLKHAGHGVHGRRIFLPARANNGSTSDETFNDVSATSRRSAGEVRNRRGREMGNPGKFI